MGDRVDELLAVTLLLCALAVFMCTISLVLVALTLGGIR